MDGILVRIGVDHAFGKWNAPVNPKTGEFVYVPIPESPNSTFDKGMERRFDEFYSHLQRFCGADYANTLKCPKPLRLGNLHVDPDFEHLTYGDDGAKRGKGIKGMTTGDLLVFYAGLRPTKACAESLIYGLVGLYVIDEIVAADSVSADQRRENAHTRKQSIGADDIVVKARRGHSGRFDRCIPIGHFRDRAYRVTPEVLNAWGGLSVKDGYIQRSAVPPRFLDAARFYDWFKQQKVKLLERNN